MLAEKRVLCFRSSKATLQHKSRRRQLTTRRVQVVLVFLPRSPTTVSTCIVYERRRRPRQRESVQVYACPRLFHCMGHSDHGKHALRNDKTRRRETAEQKNTQSPFILLRIFSGRDVFSEDHLIVTVSPSRGRCLCPLLSDLCDFHFICRAVDAG